MRGRLGTQLGYSDMPSQAQLHDFLLRYTSDASGLVSLKEPCPDPEYSSFLRCCARFLAKASSRRTMQRWLGRGGSCLKSRRSSTS
jgi:hypothetical protein